MPLAAAMPGAPIAPPASELVAGQPVWQFIPLDPEDIKYDPTQNAKGVWMPTFVIAVGQKSTGEPTGQCSVRTSGVNVTAVVPRDVKKGKKRKASPEGAEAEKSGDEGLAEDSAALDQPAAMPEPKKAKTAAKPAPKPAAPARTAVARILVLTNAKDCASERAALLSPMDALNEAQLFIAGADMALPGDTGPFSEIALSFAPGAAKKAQLIDLRAMAYTVAKCLGVTPDNLMCVIAFDETADIFHDPLFADLPNVQLICPLLVKALGSAACTHKLGGFARSPVYQSYLAAASPASGPAATPAATPASSSASSSASSPAKTPVAPPAVQPVAIKALSATLTSPSTSPSTYSARSAPALPLSPPAASEEIDLTQDD